MHLVRSTLAYAFVAALIVGAYHAGAGAATLLTVSPHAMAPILVPHVGVTAEIAERVA